MNLRSPLFSVAVLAVACTGPRAERASMEATQEVSKSLDTVAERYVKLVLAVGEHDPIYVDAYYGPPEWRERVKAQARALPELEREASALIAGMGAAPTGDAPDALRHRFLARQLEALRAKVTLLQGRRMTFDEESKALYDAVSPAVSVQELDGLIAQLEKALPGDGPLYARYDAFRKHFEIPADRLDVVFQEAIRACKTATQQHVTLPPDEAFTIEYVTDKPWGGYNWYQGAYRSLIQVNTSLPIHIDRAIDLACHEGYPGHHVYNALLEQVLMKGRGWVEFTVYPLYSPQSLIAEGSANYGIHLAFPDLDARVKFEAEKLFPLAGIPPTEARKFYEVQELVEKLELAGNEAARGRLDQGWDEARTVEFLSRYTLMPPERAKQRVRFIDTYRSYVINYNVGRRLVQQYVERRGGADLDTRWKVFVDLLSSPRLPSDLVRGSQP